MRSRKWVSGEVTAPSSSGRRRDFVGERVFNVAMARVWTALLGLSIAFFICTTTASAAVVRVQAIYQRATYLADGLYFQAAPGEANDVTIVMQGAVVTITDSVPLEAGDSCEPLSAVEVRCTTGHPFLAVTLNARLGDGDDVLRTAGTETVAASLFGGPGDDHLAGASLAGAGFHGGPGNDLMEGGEGIDTFIEDAARNGSDTMLGGDRERRCLTSGTTEWTTGCAGTRSVWTWTAIATTARRASATASARTSSG
jgi:Ca2+-binding RTX toxin-like protein